MAVNLRKKEQEKKINGQNVVAERRKNRKVIAFNRNFPEKTIFKRYESKGTSESRK
ncbi:hypothetical protein KIN20_005137 [Parelaphostrongylus tenuis]|uniref:Uncharacterized protein n=1 Tax=Parelaphostrongylus tenuis TaxID=148309 RepID=A0AAD5LZL8_PARTN|nr:hypothetical protein KIN20_005137 [Parelaphostrongylus tenuis]